MVSKNYSKGISWIDDCRIPFVDEVRTIPIHSKDEKDDKTLFGLHPTIQRKRVETTQGRFPANLLVCDDMLNDGKIHKSSIFPPMEHSPLPNVDGWNENSMKCLGGGYSDKGTNSRYYDIDKWFDKMINE